MKKLIDSIMPVYDKDDNIVAVKLPKVDLLTSFDLFYDTTCKLLKCNPRIENHDERYVIAYKPINK